MVTSLDDLTHVPEHPERPRPIVSIATGGIVTGAHYPAYRIAGYPVVAAYDPKPGRAAAVAAEWDVPRSFESLADAVAYGAEQGAVFDVATPASATAEVLRALPEGSGVLMQKPMGESYAQALEIHDLCRDRSLAAGVNFQLRQAPYVIAARRLIADGVIGEIVDIDWRVVELHPWHLWDFLFGLERMEINYHSIHYLDCIRSLVGDPTGVYCRTMQHPKMRALSQTRTAAILDYGPDLRVNLHVNHNHDFGIEHQESTLKIEGLTGAIRITLGLILDYPTGRPDRVEYVTDDGKGWRDLEVTGSWFPEAFIGTMGGLMRKLDDPHYAYANDYRDALRTMALVEACYASSASGATPVRYPE